MICPGAEQVDQLYNKSDLRTAMNHILTKIGSQVKVNGKLGEGVENRDIFPYTYIQLEYFLDTFGSLVPSRRPSSFFQSTRRLS